MTHWHIEDLMAAIGITVLLLVGAMTVSVTVIGLRWVAEQVLPPAHPAPACDE